MRTPPIIKDGELVQVCAWCYPRATYLIDFPCLRNIPVSHGICQTHCNQFQAEAKLAQATRTVQTGAYA